MAHTLDGNLSDWATQERLDTPADGTTGYAVYGTMEGTNVWVGVQSAVPISNNSTIYFNVDQNAATGAGGTGAEYFVNIVGGVPTLYTGGGVLVRALVGPPSANAEYAFGAGNTSLELKLPKALLGETDSSLDIYVDVNDSVFLPNNYSAFTYTVVDPAVLPPADHSQQRIAIVYSETTAANFFSSMAYSQLFMNAQSAAMAAGIPFDIINEADLKNLSTLVKYDAIVFPSFSNVKAADATQIANNLSILEKNYHIGIISSGDFMTNDETNASLPGNAYARMQTILGLERDSSIPLGNQNVSLNAGNTSHPILEGYTTDEAIRTYTGIGTNAFKAVSGVNGTTIVDQVVNGTTYNAAVATEIGGRNVHFATAGFMADNNMLSSAIDWVVNGTTTNAEVSIKLSRENVLLGARVDMDQAMEYDNVNPDGNTTTHDGIYDNAANGLIGILNEWKTNYNFVGSYYVDIGSNPGNQQYTNWSVSKPLYDAIVALGNELGSHSVDHPEDTNLLTPTQIQQQFQAAVNTIAQQMGIPITGTAVPGAPENLATARLIMQWVSNYLSGGAALVGAGYPSAFGYLDGTTTDKIYLAPNMSFDFTLVGFQGKTWQEAMAIWDQEFNSILNHNDMPIVIWPWHDYGPTAWQIDPPNNSPYTKEMFDHFLTTAQNAGTEFATLDDIATRMKTFEKMIFNYSQVGSTVTINATLPVNVTGTLGKFALDLDKIGTNKIASITNWYAYDEDSILLDRDGGNFVVNLGTTVADVTHITKLPMRAELVSITNATDNGVAVADKATGFTFQVIGEGKIVVDLANPLGRTLVITLDGNPLVLNSGYTLTGDKLEFNIGAYGTHDVTIAMGNVQATGNVAITGTVTEDQVLTADTSGISDLSGAITDITYQWMRDTGSGFVAIAGATASTYTLGDADVAASIQVVVTYKDAYNYTETKTSVATAPVVNVNDAPVGLPTISGTAAENSVLTASVAGITDADGPGTGPGSLAAPNFQWVRTVNGVDTDIVGATASTYTLTNDDVGATIKVRVSYTDARGTLETLTSAASGAVADQFSITGRVFADANSNQSYDNGEGTAGVTVGATGLSNVVSDANGAFRLGFISVGDKTLTFTGGKSVIVTMTTADISLSLVNGNAIYTDASYVELVSGLTEARLLGTGNGNLKGTAGDDTLIGNSGNNTLDGNGGNDTLNGGAGDDTYILGAGNATITDASGVDEIQSSISRDLVSFAGIENLRLTGSANVNAYGDDGNNVLIGNAGDNVLWGRGGSDSMYGGAGNDTYNLGGATPALIQDSSGIDTIISGVTRSLAIYGDIENLTLSGTANINGTGNALDNVITGNSGNNVLTGGDGNDTLIGNGGSDTLNGGAGNDIYVINADSPTIIDSAGTADEIQTTITRSLLSYTMIERARLLGNTNINITGNTLNNVLVGNAGNNIIDGYAGTNQLYGGAGNDTYVLANRNDLVSDSSGIDTITTTITRSLADYTGIENLILLGTANINGTGTSGDNVITGNAGNNILNGGGGNDTLIGGAGNDTYVLGSGNAAIVDSSGTDTITSTITRSLTDYTGIENLTLLGTANINAFGDAAANILIGNDGNNILRGGSGADTLMGGLGNDIYDVGGDKSDTIIDTGGIDTINTGVTWSLAGYPDIERLFLTGTNPINGTGNNLNNNIQGNAGNNILSGGLGNDSLQGGLGADTLTGGAGADYFVYLTAAESTAASRDTITDFKDSGADKIKLADVYAGVLDFVGTSAFTGTGQVRAFAQGADVIVQVNTDSNTSTVEMEIKLAGTTLSQVTAGDFVL